jgi:hypothetical protein
MEFKANEWVRQVRNDIYEATKGMSLEESLKYFRKRAAKAHLRVHEQVKDNTAEYQTTHK